MRTVHFRFDAEIIIPRWNAGNHNAVRLLPFRPGAIAVVAGIETHLSAEIPGLPSVLIDERVIHVDPIVLNSRRRRYFHGRSPAVQVESAGYKRTLPFWFPAA